ncbi:hypothetical protein KBX37_09390 [Micromonospora sp. U56]|uniref:hypothetical protein n=1 Tax=Micromonospora sp. U56 TaxID=2824900 RepID=UPI001B373195|nr:hypothetical protein [Micromonospora sp. U56]MBQ0893307.1 hypothetical protein [Micromonospora sp. U56]
MHVAGVGMVPFRKPSQSLPYQLAGAQAARAALAAAGVDCQLVQQAHAGYVYGVSTCGQAAVYGLGPTGIPIVNVNNNGATGSSALWCGDGDDGFLPAFVDLPGRWAVARGSHAYRTGGARAGPASGVSTS